MSEPVITTILTTYRRPQLLKRAVESVLSQTYPHFQLCVYDNASGDETEEIMREFVRRDSRVKYHKHPHNIGMMPNYAYAFERIDTSYFSFLSDDDYLLPCFYETALQGFHKHPEAAFSACGVTAINEQGDVIINPLNSWPIEGLYPSPKGLIEMVKKKGKIPIPTAILFQHKVVKDISPDWRDEIRLLWDPDYLMRISASFPIVITKKTSAIYIAHSTAFSSSFYDQIKSSAEPLHIYLKATKEIETKLRENIFLDEKTKKIVIATFENMIRLEVCFFLYRYIIGGLSKEGCKVVEILEQYYKKDYKIRIMDLLAKLSSRFVLFETMTIKLFSLARFSVRFCKRVRTKKKLSIAEN